MGYWAATKVKRCDALDMVDTTIMTQPVNYVVDIDIAKFFDTGNHHCLMECLNQRDEAE
jgi:retron-type reverse transcriptase